MFKKCKCGIEHKISSEAPPKFYKCAFCGDVLIGEPPDATDTMPVAPAISTLPTDPSAGVFATSEEATGLSNLSAPAAASEDH